MPPRHELGLDETTPLIGAFGHIKPYKRIAESLRAFRRLVKLEPRARMILVGEPHPEFPVDQLIRTLGLREHVRLIGFRADRKIRRLYGRVRHRSESALPHCGRNFRLICSARSASARAVIVSDVGSFSELPDDICLKVPPGAGGRRSDLRVPERAGFEAGSGARHGRTGKELGRAGMQLERSSRTLSGFSCGSPLPRAYADSRLPSVCGARRNRRRTRSA